jgi:hypothetical protein
VCILILVRELPGHTGAHGLSGIPIRSSRSTRPIVDLDRINKINLTNALVNAC